MNFSNDSIQNFPNSGSADPNSSWENNQRYMFVRRVAIGIIVVLSIIFLSWAIVSRTSGEIADLSLSPTAASVTADTSFPVVINVDTKNNNVVVVKGIVTYNPDDFQLINWDTTSSVFSEDNPCVYDGKPCEIITNDPAQGSIIITLSKPSPGVNTAAGKIATLNFKALHAIAPTEDNIKLQYVAYGNYDDSDVILDDEDGTDILNQVTNAQITAVLPVPTELAGAPISATQVNLTWNNAGSVGITGYKVFRNGEQIATSSVNSYQDSGLSPSTVYNYKVSAFDAAGNESGQTSQVAVTTLADTTKPNVPGGLNASGISMTEIDLNWTASTDDVGVTRYNVYRNGTKVGTSVTTSYSDTGLTVETQYDYQVSAVDAAGNESDKSAQSSASTQQDSEEPAVPGNVTATAVSMTQVNVNWTASTDNVEVTGYNIYRNGGKIGVSTTTSYSDTGLTPATQYSYTVSAVDAKGNESDKSPSVAVSTNSDTEAPSMPTNVTAMPVSMTQINLNWTVSTDNIGVVGYNIYRNGTKVGTSPTASYQDTNLERGTQYAYTITALDAVGLQSVPSAAVTVSTLSDSESPTVPSNVTGTAVSIDQINLTWSASTDNIGVIGYRVYRNGEKIADITETSYEDKGLLEDTSYAYSVTAYDTDQNESQLSPSISVKTLFTTYGLNDFVNLVADWLEDNPDSPAEINGDGVVNSQDLGIMMSHWEK